MRRNPIGRKALSFLLSFAMILSVFGVDTAGAFAAVNDSGVKNSGFSAMRNAAPVTLYLDSGDIVITETGYSVNNGTEVLCTGGYEITQNGSGEVSHRITVRSGNQDITLQGVHAKPADGAAFEIENGAEADITLSGSNSLDSSVSSDFCAGLSVNEGGTVRISGTGSLTATGQPLYGAGIGGNNGQSCGTVEISGGTVTATGGDGGAGIGGGFSGSGGSITISGGTVKATGGDDGAGIGGGYRGSGGSITISGGSVKATGGDDGAGIGGGKGGDGGTITISGGTVTANGGPGGAGVGGGKGGDGGTITISGGTVTATGGVYGSGIGGGYLGNGGAVTISGADTHVTAKGQDDGEDIGSGYRSNDGGSLKVSDGATAAMLNSSPSLNTNASTAYTDCQIITGSTETKYDKDGNVSSTRTVLYLDSGDIVITETGYSVNGGTEVACTGDYVITQSGSDNVKHSITAQGGKQNITLQNVHAQPDSGLAAFKAEAGAEADITLAGSNSLDSSGSSLSAGLAVNGGSTVRISGTGSLTATGGLGGAGVGGNYQQSCGTVEISGGTVKATGGDGGAGIGGGYIGSGGSITIRGGTVTATGGEDSRWGSGGGAGVGGGIGGSGGIITISGGTVTATGGKDSSGITAGGAGIGGGNGGDGGTITISGGTVTATGGKDSAGIGGGNGGSGGIITVSGGSVTATGGQGGAGVGGGTNGTGGSITVSGGTVTAAGGVYGSGIGGGYLGNGGAVTISGADTQVTAKGQGDGEDIGSGYRSNDGGSLKVSDGATAAMLNSSPSLNTNASTDYTNCQIITGGTETKYDKDGNVSSTRTVLYLDSGDIVIMETGYSVDGGDEVLYTGGYVITQSGSDNVKHSITVKGGQQNITLQNVRAQPDSGLAAFEAEAGADADITLSGSNSLDSSGNSFCAGLAVNAGSKVRISGTGSLKATGGSGGAGVGGNYGQSCGMVKISCGTVTATGGVVDAGIGAGAGGAGIGSGAGGAGGDITITGGIVNATGSAGGAGIGGGIGGSGGSIMIGGGTVTATGSNSENFGGGGAGIGGGTGGSGGMVTINDGVVTAAGGEDSSGIGGAGIGGGDGGDSGGTIKISGGTVTATGGKDSAGIGGGASGSGGSITVNGGTVTATGGQDGAGVGGGTNGTGGSITVSGGTVTAAGGYFGAGIGGGYLGNGGAVTILGRDTQVTAKGQGGGEDIGSGGGNNNGGTLTVDDVSTVDGPAVELLSAGTNAAKQLMNCVIHGAGAKDASGDLSGCYDENGKIRLSISMQTPASAKIGEPVTLNASVTKYNPDVQKYQFDPASLPGTVQFTGNGTPLGSPAGLTNGTAQISWTPANGNKVSLKAAYVPATDDRYASAESAAIDYTPGKITPVIGTAPTASPVKAGEKLSASKLTGGTAAANGKQIPGAFSWAHPDTAVTASGSYEAIFTPTDTATYNTVNGILVAVTVAAAPSSGSHSSSASAPSLPSSLTDALTNMTVDLSGARFPSWVTGVSLSASPFTQGGSSGASDAQGGAVYRLVISQTGLNLIGSPFVYNIHLLDQSGSPVTYFTGTVTVRIPLPTDLRGTPRVFRYESDGTLTDMNAAVENGFLVFQTSHFSDYVVAGTGDSITLDTKDYSMPVGGKYQIGVKLTGMKAAAVKFHSTNDKVATVAKLKNGNYQVTGNGLGTAYIMFDVYDNKNKLLTHASVRVDVKTGIRPRGDSTRQIGVF